MKPKTRSWSLLKPGASGWELWKFRPGTPPACIRNPSLAQACSAPRLAVALPTQALAALPLWLPSAGDLRELAELELGARHMLRRGMEVHCVPVCQGETRSLVLAVASGEVQDGTDFFRGAGRFEANARTWLPLGADVVLWKEWEVPCFAIFRDDDCVFFSLGGPLEASLGGVIGRTLLRLQAEGVIERTPKRARLYGEFSAEECRALEAGLDLEIELATDPPHPFLPAAAADLPPASMREHRASRQYRSRLARIGLVAAILYAIIVLAAAGDWFEKSWNLRALREEASSLESSFAAAREAISGWRQVRHAVDPSAFALDLLAAVAAELPGDQIRLTAFSLAPDGLAVAGEAKDVAQAYQFIEKIKRSPALAEFDWTASQPELAGKQTVRFAMEGRRSDAQSLAD